MMPRTLPSFSLIHHKFEDRNMKQQKGLSLIELMISITLGLMLMLGVLNVFLGSRGAFVSQQAISRIQESGRFAIDYMNKEIRMAGFLGCASNVDDSKIITTLGTAGVFRWDYKTIVKGYTDTTMPAGSDPAATGTKLVVKAGTDVLEIVSASGTQVLVTADTTTGSLTTTASDCLSGGLCANDILVASDCQKAQIFQATSMSGSPLTINHAAGSAPGNATPVWTDKLFGAGAEVTKMRKMLFYIKNNAAGVPSLWLWDNGLNSELVEGVEDMDIQYGIDTTGDDDVPDVYKTAADVTTGEWADVKSVHIELLVRTPEDRVLAEPQKYTFPLSSASATTPTDRVMRQVFVSTVAVRSRLN
jgi:type IV pilus assembly protein PilW